jgi:hypothetical protein
VPDERAIQFTILGSNTVTLEKAMMKQIEDFAKGHSARIKLLTGFASKLNATIRNTTG